MTYNFQAITISLFWKGRRSLSALTLLSLNLSSKQALQFLYFSIRLVLGFLVIWKDLGVGNLEQSALPSVLEVSSRWTWKSTNFCTDLNSARLWRRLNLEAIGAVLAFLQRKVSKVQGVVLIVADDETDIFTVSQLRDEWLVGVCFGSAVRARACLPRPRVWDVSHGIFCKLIKWSLRHFHFLDLQKLGSIF